MSRGRTLRVLVGMRQRRERPLAAALADSVQAREAAVRAEDEARLEVQAAHDREQAQRTKLRAMAAPGATFDPLQMLSYEHHVEAMKGQVIDAQRTCDARAADAVAAGEHVKARRGDVTRNQQKIDRMQAERKALRDAEMLAADDQQDEESEEAAISRMLAASRAAAAAAEMEAA